MHDFEWDDVKILHTEPNVKKREFMEMLYIKRNHDTLNKKTDLNFFHPSYEIFLKSLL